MAKASNGTAVATRPAQPAQTQTQAPRKDFLAKLDDARSEIARLLPDPKKVDRVIRITRTAYMMKAELRECTPESIIGAVMKASELDLEPDGAQQDGYLVKFGKECSFLPSYRGLCKLARRSGEYEVIDARPIYAKDLFSLEYTPHPVFRHVPSLDDDPGPVTHAYAYARMAGGGEIFRLITRKQIEAARNQNRFPNSVMWTKFYEEGARKVALKKMLKGQPSSIEMAEAIELDNVHGMVEARTVESSRAGLSRTERMVQRLEGPPDEPEFTEGTSGQVATEPPDDEQPDSVEAEAADIDTTEAGSRG